MSPLPESIGEITQMVERVARDGLAPPACDSNRRMQLLFVDDESNVLSGLRRMLRSYRQQWDMRFCASGAEALTAMTEAPADVVISDMRMPEMDGLQLLEQVAARWPATVRFILSGNARKGEVIRTIGPVHQYLAKPCDPNVLQQTLQRTVRLKQTIDLVGKIEIVTGFRHLPGLPSVFVDLEQAMRNPEVPLAELALIIERDPGLTIRILKTVNSAFFGLKRQLVTVVDALAVLGLEAVQALAIGHGTFEQEPVHQALEPTVQRLWDHSQRVASLARRIAREAGLEHSDIDAAFFAGLMHDIGILVCLSEIPETYLRLLKATQRHGVAMYLAERSVLGVDHAQIGGYLLGLWGIGDHVVEAVVTHHIAPAEARPRSIADCVYLADQLDAHAGGGIQPDIGLVEHDQTVATQQTLIAPWLHVLGESA